MRSFLVLSLVIAASQAIAYDCARKYCKNMESCEEAKYKLKQCGHKSLDRDKDGVPCENICPGG